MAPRLSCVRRKSAVSASSAAVIATKTSSLTFGKKSAARWKNSLARARRLGQADHSPAEELSGVACRAGEGQRIAHRSLDATGAERVARGDPVGPRNIRKGDGGAVVARESEPVVHLVGGSEPEAGAGEALH
jgi:hypothetical protein